MKIRKEDVYEHLELLYEIVGDEKYLEIVIFLVAILPG